MTIDNWLMIAVIISTLIAPILAVLVQSRINQPKQTPVTNQPPSLIQRIGGWFRKLLSSVWLLVGVIAYNLVILTLELRKSVPLTRWGVLFIVIPVASILLCLQGISFHLLIGLIRDFVNDYREDLVRQRDLNRDFMGLFRDITDTVRATVGKPEQPNPPNEPGA